MQEKIAHFYVSLLIAAMKKLALIYIAFVLTGMACKKKKEPEAPQVTHGSLKIDFRNMVDDEALQFNKNYLNPSGDSFTVNKFIYYISNIILTKDDQSAFAIPESYYLLNHSNPGSLTLNLAGIPEGTYRSLSFVLGVDSARSSAGVKSGALDPANGMYWAWSSGYIFLKLEGKAPKSNSGDLTYHVGGYQGANKTQRTIHIALAGNPVQIKADGSPSVGLKVNVNEMFKNPKSINFATQNHIMSEGTLAKTFADNYADMITLDKIQN